ncbi:PHF7 protein, partial [Chloroceryle aenea]|nr:PHF7 protein [Chloroceryle aenea]
VCMFCHRAVADPELCGAKIELPVFCAHKFCLYFASQLYRQPVEQAGWVRYSREDIRRVIARAAQKDCCVCRKSGAAITCSEMGCECSFHLPCAAKGGCVAQYRPPYRYLLSSLCQHH